MELEFWDDLLGPSFPCWPPVLLLPEKIEKHSKMRKSAEHAEKRDKSKSLKSRLVRKSAGKHEKPLHQTLFDFFTFPDLIRFSAYRNKRLLVHSVLKELFCLL